MLAVDTSRKPYELQICVYFFNKKSWFPGSCQEATIRDNGSAPISNDIAYQQQLIAIHLVTSLWECPSIEHFHGCAQWYKCPGLSMRWLPKSCKMESYTCRCAANSVTRDPYRPFLNRPGYDMPLYAMCRPQKILRRCAALQLTNLPRPSKNGDVECRLPARHGARKLDKYIYI